MHLQVCAAIAVALAASGAMAQTEPQPEPAAPPAEPLLVVQVSSLQKILSRIEANLTSVEREDVLEAVEDFLADQAGDLEGLDRGRPFGVAMFLPEVLPPQPVTVAYAPLTDIDGLIKTMQLGPVTVEKDAQTPGSKEAHYTLKLQRGGTRYLVVRDGYAFISRDENYLDGDVATLAKLAPQLEARYDAAITLRIKSVSPLIRDVFLGFLRTQTETQLQRRDDEPLSQYMIRRANGMSSLELIERVIRDGEQITLGIDLPEGSESTIVELNVDAAADSEFAQYLTDLASHPSSYGAMVNDQAPFTFSASWMMEPREQKVGTEWVNSLERSLNERLAALDPSADTADPTRGPDAEPPSHSSVTRVVDPLQAMIDAGHLDVCVQFRALEPGQFGLIGAMHLVGGETFASGLRELLSTLKAQGDDLNVTLDAEKHGDIIFHRLEAKEVPDRDRRLYGEGSGLYVGSSARTLWFAVGSSRAMTELKSAIDRVEESATEPPARQAPVQLVLRANEWLELPRDENAPPGRGELADEAFTGDNDMLKIEVRPTESGARVRLELAGGFARLVALWMSQQYDRSQL
jgi:hypothetical protein